MSRQTELIIEELKSMGSSEIAEHSSRFFKTGKGEYGEGDIFLGIRVPVLRKMAARHRQISLDDCLALLPSPYHETRLLSLLILVEQFKKGDPETREKIYNAYLNHRQYVNNWDLVDSSAHLIAGPYLLNRKRTILYELAGSDDLFERRIAIMTSFCFIKAGDFKDSLALSDRLLTDNEDLIHKAVGWMLREIGNRNQEVEENFLKERYMRMPRTMLRYAIEKFPPEKRKAYLKGDI